MGREAFFESFTVASDVDWIVQQVRGAANNTSLIRAFRNKTVGSFEGVSQRGSARVVQLSVSNDGEYEVVIEPLDRSGCRVTVRQTAEMRDMGLGARAREIDARSRVKHAMRQTRKLLT